MRCVFTDVYFVIHLTDIRVVDQYLSPVMDIHLEGAVHPVNHSDPLLDSSLLEPPLLLTHITIINHLSTGLLLLIILRIQGMCGCVYLMLL